MIANNLENSCKWFFIEQQKNSLQQGFQGIEAFLGLFKSSVSLVQ